MLQHVTVEQPEPWVVRDEYEVCFLASLEKIGIAFPVEERPVIFLDPKVMTVEVHCVGPTCVVPDLDTDRLAQINVGQVIVMLRDPSIERPRFFMVLSEFTDRPQFAFVVGLPQVTHRPALHVEWYRDID